MSARPRHAARPQAAPGAERTGAPPPLVAASILSADFTRLDRALAIVDPERDWVHCDIMDGHFVPNISFGPLVVAAVTRLTPAWRDVHLMIERPETYAAVFRAAGADRITLHLEACADPAAALDAVRATGARAGLAIKPGTPFEAALPFLPGLDLLLVMTVEPGFGGQSFMPGALDKVRAAVAWRARQRASLLVEVDGGINPETSLAARAAGADAFVAGHAIFDQPDPGDALDRLRKAVGARRG